MGPILTTRESLNCHTLSVEWQSQSFTNTYAYKLEFLDYAGPQKNIGENIKRTLNWKLRHEGVELLIPTQAFIDCKLISNDAQQSNLRFSHIYQ